MLVASPQCTSVLIIDSEIEEFYKSPRGLLQGDPLLPFLIKIVAHTWLSFCQR